MDGGAHLVAVIDCHDREIIGIECARRGRARGAERTRRGVHPVLELAQSAIMRAGDPERQRPGLPEQALGCCAPAILPVHVRASLVRIVILSTAHLVGAPSRRGPAVRTQMGVLGRRRSIAAPAAGSDGHLVPHTPATYDACDGGAARGVWRMAG